MSRYQAVDSLKAEFAVAALCRAVGVSASAYYQWTAQVESDPTDAETEEAALLAEIGEIHRSSGGSYGSPRVTSELRDRGWRVNHKRVERLMAVHDIVGFTGRKGVRTTIPAETSPKIPDLVGRDFKPGKPDERWAGDISYIPTGEGWLYLAPVLDLGSRACVGVSMADHMRTSLVGSALSDAVGMRRGVTPELFHSDRGSQYTSAEYGELCTSLGIVQSVGRTGVCWDNAVLESFLGTLKRELLWNGARVFETRAQARAEITRWIAWYNQRRRHSTLGMIPPYEWERRWYTNNGSLQEAA